MRLLYVEDEQDIAKPLISALQKKTYVVDYAEDGKTALELSEVNEYDCIILDLNLPEIDGIDVAKTIRSSENNTPILMLTARTTQNNIAEGFMAGTDDYLVKPFHFRELLFRIEALIKRNSLNTAENLVVGDIVLDSVSKNVTSNGDLIPLNAKEYGILEYLLRNKGRPVTQEELLEHVWDMNVDMFTQTVRTNIKTLRKKIDPNKEIIETIVGQGYIIK